MEVYLAENLGFCYGVKRAIQLAEDSVSPDTCSYTLGSIIHNPQMVARLAEEGIGKIESLDEIQSGTVIVRSHGVGPHIYAKIEEKGLGLVDATCPHVRKAQNAAKQLADDGYQVVIVGDKNHPEVRSILEWAGEGAVAVNTEEEADALPRYGSKIEKDCVQDVGAVLGYKDSENYLHRYRSTPGGGCQAGRPGGYDDCGRGQK